MDKVKKRIPYNKEIVRKTVKYSSHITKKL